MHLNYKCMNCVSKDICKGECTGYVYNEYVTCQCCGTVVHQNSIVALKLQNVAFSRLICSDCWLKIQNSIVQTYNLIQSLKKN